MIRDLLYKLVRFVVNKLVDIQCLLDNTPYITFKEWMDETGYVECERCNNCPICHGNGMVKND